MPLAHWSQKSSTVPIFLFSNDVPVTARDVLSLVIGGSSSPFIEQHSYNKQFLVWQAAYVFHLERSIFLIQSPLLSIL